MANINQKWKKFLAVGCNHGHLVDSSAQNAVLKFVDIWKPDTKIHLGDYVDTAAFRSGASLKDQNVSLESDMSKGLKFIQDYAPDILFNGNHDIRLWINAKHHNAIVASCAQSLIEDVHKVIPQKCNFIESYDIRKSFITLGDTKFLHGFMYDEQALRNHAEHFGKCVIAHLHKVASMPGRRVDSPTCYCVGYLGDGDKFSYNLQRRSMSQWSQGFAWGEYSDKECRVWLNERNKGGKWRLPL